MHIQSANVARAITIVLVGLFSIVTVEVGFSQSSNSANTHTGVELKGTKKKLSILRKRKKNAEQEVSSLGKRIHTMESLINRNERAVGRFGKTPEIHGTSPDVDVFNYDKDNGLRINIRNWLRGGKAFVKVSEAELDVIDDYIGAYLRKEIENAGGSKQRATWSIAGLYDFIDGHLENDTKTLKSSLEKAKIYLSRARAKLKRIGEEQAVILAVVNAIPNVCQCFDFCATQPIAESRNWCIQNRQKDWCSKMIDMKIEKYFEGNVPALRQEIVDRNKQVFRDICRGN